MLIDMKRQVRVGHVARSSAWEVRPVMRSGQRA